MYDAHHDSLSRKRLLTIAIAALVGAALFAAIRFGLTDTVDRPIVLAINSIAGNAPLFDLALRAFDRFAMFQGVLLMTIAAAAFARTDGTGRLRLAAGVFAASVAAVVSRLCQIFTPSAPRPMFDPAIDFHAPIGADLTIIKDWSSFPSDHAALLLGIACAVFIVDRRLALLGFLVALASGVVRVYEGAHYLTDSFGGWCIAIAVVFGVGALKLTLTPKLSELAFRHRGFLAAAGFFTAVEAAYLYDDIRQFLSSLAEHL